MSIIHAARVRYCSETREYITTGKTKYGTFEDFQMTLTDALHTLEATYRHTGEDYTVTYDRKCAREAAKLSFNAEAK